MIDHQLNSLEFIKTNFAPHGQTRVQVGGSIFWLETIGPFNMEGVKAINALRLHILSQQSLTEPYAYINVWTGSLLIGRDALLEYAKGVEEAYRHRFQPPAAMAWVAGPEVEGAAIMESHLLKIFGSTGIPFRLFEDAQQARKWVEECLETKRMNDTTK